MNFLLTETYFWSTHHQVSGLTELSFDQIQLIFVSMGVCCDTFDASKYVRGGIYSQVSNVFWRNTAFSEIRVAFG